MKGILLILSLAVALVMIPPMMSGADLWCETLGVDCEQIQQEQMPEPKKPEEIVMTMVVECIRDGKGTDEEARECWKKVGERLKERL